MAVQSLRSRGIARVSIRETFQSSSGRDLQGSTRGRGLHLRGAVGLANALAERHGGRDGDVRRLCAAHVLEPGAGADAQME